MTTRGDRKTFKNEDLILKVSKNINPNTWDESRYEAFLDELCGNREYQKDAIRTALRFMLGGRYSDLRQLARENYDANEELKQRYGSFSGMERHLQLPNHLACSIDQATGTGKSYVLYGLAVILLAEGAVDRVLVLCPSNTIEAGLLEKFRLLSANADLAALLPAEAKISAPRVITASESIVEGSICVENYHAILQKTRSSIRDSLKGKGARVAVLNDESHHVANETGAGAKKWKEFLADPEYGFRLIVGVSGTCYIGDEYFADVVSRYSLRQAIEERFVKSVDYVTEMPDTDAPEEKWQLVYNRHKEWKRVLKKQGIRPLTIVVTRDINGCELVAEELREFLAEWEEIPLPKASEKVLAVSSAPQHQANLAKLKSVDRPESKVEWIVSVSMLNEGWDVKNVFQIVPHEERAFNSKLLIAQVLGRGLRRPDGWQGADPIVTVFNHDAWSGRIKHLVNEILEVERRLSSVVDPESPYNFELHNLDYTREEDTTEHAKTGEYRLFERGFVELPTQVETEAAAVEFERAVTGERVRFETKIQHKTFSIEEVAEQMYQRLRSIDEESRESSDPDDRTSYSQKFTRKLLVGIVEESLRKANIRSGKITDDNRQKFLQALGTLRRKSAKRVVYKLKPKMLVSLTTKERQVESCSASELRRQAKSVFCRPDSEIGLPDDQKEFFAEVLDPDGDFAAASITLENAHDFKSPVNLAIADAGPERKFLRELTRRENASVIDGWLKSSPVGFYSIEYAWKKGEHPKRGEFNPDLFVKQGDGIYVIEIKDDAEAADPSAENIKKHEFALQHFERLNEWLKKAGVKTTYYFNMLTPKDFSKFFTKLRNGEAAGFRSELDVAVARASEA